MNLTRYSGSSKFYRIKFKSSSLISGTYISSNYIDQKVLVSLVKILTIHHNIEHNLPFGEKNTLIKFISNQELKDHNISIFKLGIGFKHNLIY